MEEYEVGSCIRGYHVYQAFWESNIGDTFVTFHCKQESHKTRNRYTVAVKKDDEARIGHVLRKISCIWSDKWR